MDNDKKNTIRIKSVCLHVLSEYKYKKNAYIKFCKSDITTLSVEMIGSVLVVQNGPYLGLHKTHLKEI